MTSVSVNLTLSSLRGLNNGSVTGLDQAGLSSTIAHSISLLPEELQGMFWANIGLVGGSTKFSGFRARLYVLILLRSYASCELLSLERTNFEPWHPSTPKSASTNPLSASLPQSLPCIRRFDAK